MNIYLQAFFVALSIILPSASGQNSASGKCVWYGAEGEIAEGWPTACGQFHRLANTTASPNAPSFCGKKLLVTNRATGKSVLVTVNDKGPGQDTVPVRILDLTWGAFRYIGDPDKGMIDCSYKVVP